MYNVELFFFIKVSSLIIASNHGKQKDVASCFEHTLKTALQKKRLYGHLPPIAQIIKVIRTGNAGHCYRSNEELINTTLYHGLIHMDIQVLTYQQILTFIRTVRSLDAVWRAYQKRWPIVSDDDIYVNR